VTDDVAQKATSAERLLEKQERLAKHYDAEVLPAYGQRFADLLSRLIDVRPAARVVEVGCATGHLTLELARRFDAETRLTAFDEAPAFLALAQARLALAARHAAPVRVALELASPEALPLADASADVVVSNLTAAMAADPARAVRELGRVLAPGGQAVLTAPLRGSWVEFVDLYRDVLLETGRAEAVTRLGQEEAALPDPATVIGWMEAAGLADVELTVERWEILFKSAREFFFAPLVELGPLSRWKRVAGRGEEVQDAFFFVKEAIDTYYKGSAFAVTIVGAAVKGWKPIPAAP
jgi:SAM-dependent methyltransferase